eukprot:Platyproteum_vivax@DN7477_c2_g1_i4.p1
MNFLTVALLFVCGCMSRGLKIKESKLNRRLLSRTTLNYQKTYVLYLTFGHMVEKKNPNHWNPNKNCEKMFNMDYTGEIKPYGTIALKVPHFVRNYIRKDMRLIMEAIFLKFLTISPENWLIMRPMVDGGTIAKDSVGRFLTGRSIIRCWGNQLTEPEIITDLWDIDHSNLKIVKEGGHLSYPLYSEAILQVFNRYLSGDLELEASKGGTFVIFVGRPTQLFDTTKWEFKGGFRWDHKYQYEGQYEGRCVVAINHESPELMKHLRSNWASISLEIGDRLKKTTVLQSQSARPFC